MENLQLDLEHLVAMNSLSSNMISFPAHFVINPECLAFSLVIEPRMKLYLHFPLPVQRDQNLFPSYAFVGYTEHKFHLGHTMETLRAQGKACRVVEL
jgi:hypothetical protein